MPKEEIGAFKTKLHTHTLDKGGSIGAQESRASACECHHVPEKMVYFKHEPALEKAKDVVGAWENDKAMPKQGYC